MTAISRVQFDGHLKERRLEPLYLLNGGETYLRDAAGRAITDAALEGTLIREFNESHFSLLNSNAKEAITAAEQLPLMSSLRVITIRDFAKIHNTDEETLISYLQRPAPSSVVIFLATELDKRRKLTNVLLDTCLLVEFPPLKDGEAKAWVKLRLKELKFTAGEQVLSELIALVGTDVQTLSSELEKLAAAAIKTRTITMTMVDELIGRSRELSNFELGDHLLTHNRQRALETLHRLLEDGAEPVMLIGAIAGNYHRLAVAKEILTRGSREDVFRTLPMPFFKRDAFLSSLQRTNIKKLAQAIKLIAAADLAIKTSQATPRLQLEMLVCELAA